MSSPEYLQRLKTPFSPPTHTLAQLRAAVPQNLYKKSTLKSSGYVFRDVVVVLLLFIAAVHSDDIVESLFTWIATSVEDTDINPIFHIFHPRQNPKYITVILAASQVGARWSLWTLYWVSQSLAGAAMWCLGHELGHHTLFVSPVVNDAIGFVLHTFLLVPYYSWKSTHRAHHKATSSAERDENYAPSTRSSLRLPPRASTSHTEHHDLFEETPLYTLYRMMAMQLFGWQAYLCWNALGSPMYPRGTNHFDPSSKLFKPRQRFYIKLSNWGLVCMLVLLFTLSRSYGIKAFIKFYFIPYVLMNHWIVMLTYLHHTDPSIPHYRKNEWTYVRGAAATVDRPLLGWAGRFFFHNVSHDHTAHHYFPMIPFYNQPLVTEAIKPVLGDSYNYDSTNAFYALHRSFTECQFIEDDEPIAFYKNSFGTAQRAVASKKAGEGQTSSS